MKITEIILENKETIELLGKPEKSKASKRKATLVAKFMKKNCQPWLSQTDNGDQVVWRGIRDVHLSAFVKQTRPNRIPSDSPDWVHAMYNTIIAQAGGIANRTNSIFCSGSRGTALNYGVAYTVIPIGEFHYTWSPSYMDWYSSRVYFPSAVMDDNARQHIQHIANEWNAGRMPEEEYMRLTKEIKGDPKSYTDKNKLDHYVKVDKNLKGAIESGHEIMIQCSSGLYISYELYPMVRLVLPNV